ncbi:MAG: YvcK family protein [Chloroflexia bacterium]|nr:YvcK family protein [Chloroflexia bacterium]
MNRRTLRMWLRPGMKIKRWMALFMFAIVLTSLALAMGAAWIYDNYSVPARLQEFVEVVTLQIVPHPWRGLILLGGGLILFGFALWKLSHSLVSPLLKEITSGRTVAEIFVGDRFGPVPAEFNVVTIGGGTGLGFLLRGLKQANVNLTAIVTVADDGGSTGRIRDAFDIPAPGDIRNCLVSLAEDESTMSQLFHYRFDKDGSELSGHSFGNLFITAMTQVTGSFEQAVLESARVLNVRGRVLPSTLENVTLCANMASGDTVRGESAIAHERPAISDIFFDPPHPRAYDPALAAILNADLIVLGPGSLYTSVLPNLLVDGIREAISWSQGDTVYVCNVATQEGETDHYGYDDHVREVVKYLGEGELDYVLVNDNPAAGTAIRPDWHVEAVIYDGAAKSSNGVDIIARDVVNDQNPLRHDPVKLAAVLLDLARERPSLAQLPVTLAVANGLEPDEVTALIGGAAPRRQVPAPPG